jgi:hypothetical protein
MLPTGNCLLTLRGRRLNAKLTAGECSRAQKSVKRAIPLIPFAVLAKNSIPDFVRLGFPFRKNRQRFRAKQLFHRNLAP